MTFQEWFFPQKLIKTYLIKHLIFHQDLHQQTSLFLFILFPFHFSDLLQGFSAFRVNTAGPGTPGTRVRDVLESWAPKAPAKAATPEKHRAGQPNGTTTWTPEMWPNSVRKRRSISFHITKGFFAQK
jgi:hypothetical protein